MTEDSGGESAGPVSDRQVEEIRQSMTEELRRLARSMEITDEAARPVELDQQAVGRLSRMDSLQNQHLTRNLKEREEVRVSALVRALSRIEEGKYGLCVGCGDPIEEGRLAVFPEAEHCAACGG